MKFRSGYPANPLPIINNLILLHPIKMLFLAHFSSLLSSRQSSTLYLRKKNKKKPNKSELHHFPPFLIDPICAAQQKELVRRCKKNARIRTAIALR